MNSATHVYLGRPCEITRVQRVQHALKYRGFYNLVSVRFLDGAEPRTAAVPAGKFNAAARIAASR